MGVMHTGSDLKTETDLNFSSSSLVSFIFSSDAKDKERIIRTQKQINGNEYLTAKLPNIGRITLHAKIDKYGIKTEKNFR